MAALTFKVGGDTSGLGTATNKAKGMLSGLAKFAKGAAIGGMLAGAAASAVALVKGFGGLRDAIDLGGDLSDLASQTGIAVGELVVLQRALRDNGASAADAGPLINKMQKGIVDLGAGLSTQVRAFGRLGLSYDEIASKSPGDQFELIQKRIAAMEDPTKRAGTAMEVFGRSGAKLLAMFDDASAMDKARVSVGGQAEILEKNAAELDRSSDLMKGIGDKFMGFFVGMAPFVNALLLPVLENINKIDLAGYGAAVGRFFAMFGEAFKQGAIPTMIKDGLLIAGKELINFLVKGFRGLIAGLLAQISAIPRMFMGMIRMMADPEMWSGVGKILIGLGKKMSVAFLQMIPERLREGADVATASDLNFFNRKAGEDILAGKNQIMRSQGFSSYIEALKTSAGEVSKAFMDEMDGSDVIDASGERKRLGESLDKLRDAVDKNSESKEEEEEKKAGLVLPGDGEGFATGFLKPIVSSLGKVGGAALSGVQGMTMDRERNKLLNMIERNTREGLGPAVYA
jgi:hypothetical protein